MYCIAPNTGRNTLITPQEVIEYANVSDNMDMKIIRNSIIVAEERFIVPLIGFAAYSAFCSAKNVAIDGTNSATIRAAIDTQNAAYGIAAISDADWATVFKVNAIELCSDIYQQVWNQYLLQICAEAVHAQLVVVGWTRTTAAGEMQNAPKSITGNSDVASASMKDVKMKQDNIYLSRITPLCNAFKDWMCYTMLALPYFDNSYCNVKKENANSFGLAMGGYDDKDDEQNKAAHGATQNTLGWN